MGEKVKRGRALAASIKHKVSAGLPNAAVVNCADNSGAKNLRIVSVCNIGGRLNRLPKAGSGDMVITFGHQSSNSGRRGIKHIYLMLFDNLPATGNIRIVRNPLEQECYRTITQRTIQDIAVSGNPTEVRRAPVNITVLIIKN